MIELKFKKLVPSAKIPVKISGNVGIDLSVIVDDANRWLYHIDTNHKKPAMSYFLQPGERVVFNTGLSVEIPDGYALIIKDRSGLAAKNGIHVLAGVIDSSYRGEIKVCLLNTSKNYDGGIWINEGDRIAQGILTHDIACDIIEVAELSETTRGEKGFGSSGK